MKIENSGAVSVIFVFDGKATEDFIRRLEGARRAMAGMKQKWNWVLVCDGCSKGLLEANPLVRRLGAQLLETGRTLGDWPAFYQGAVEAGGDWLLLLPGKSELGKDILKKMFALSAGQSWVNASQGRPALWLKTVLDFASSAAPADLGSPCLVRRELFVSMASHYTLTEAFFGYRVFSKICAGKAGVVSVSGVSGEPSPYLSAERILGLDRAKLSKKAMRVAEGVFISLAIVIVGSMIYGHQPVVGLSLLGVGSLMLASFFGKAE